MMNIKTRQVGFRVSEELFKWLQEQRAKNVNISEALTKTLEQWKREEEVPTFETPTELKSRLSQEMINKFVNESLTRLKKELEDLKKKIEDLKKKRELD